MYLISEPSYSTTNWYQSSLAALKNRARKKRVTLAFSTSAADAAEESCAFVLGGSASWISQTVHQLQICGCHPIILSELPNYDLFGKYSSVKTDYNRFMSALYQLFYTCERRRTAFYGMNPASFSDMSRKNAFLSCFAAGEIFENNGSLQQCFDAFWSAHQKEAFDAVICANDFAAVSLLVHLKRAGADPKSIRIAVHSNARLLGRFPEIVSARVDHEAVAAAAFEIAACIEGNPEFIGMHITVDCRPEADGAIQANACVPSPAEIVFESQTDALYTDTELSELMRIEHLLSECDETDIKILRLLGDSADEIAENTFLSDNGVKYRIKKMKKICGVESKREIPLLLSKYDILI